MTLQDFPNDSLGLRDAGSGPEVTGIADLLLLGPALVHQRGQLLPEHLGLFVRLRHRDSPGIPATILIGRVKLSTLTDATRSLEGRSREDLEELLA